MQSIEINEERSYSKKCRWRSTIRRKLACLIQKKGLSLMPVGEILIAFLIILLGIYWMLNSLGIISPEMMPMIFGSLPYLVLLFAALLLIGPLFNRKKPNYFPGLFLLLYGGLLLANQWDMLTFHWQDFWKLWPYLIIYVGLTILFDRHVTFSVTGGGRRPRKKINEEAKHSEAEFHWTADDHEEDSDSAEKAFVNESTYKQDNWMVKPMNERVRIGNYTFDFTRAFIPEEMIPIRLSGWVGDIKITLPEDLEFRIDLKAKVGDAKIGKDKQSGVLRNISYQTDHYDDAVRKINFTFDFQVIDLSIDQV